MDIKEKNKWRINQEYAERMEITLSEIRKEVSSKCSKGWCDCCQHMNNVEELLKKLSFLLGESKQDLIGQKTSEKTEICDLHKVPISECGCAGSLEEASE